MILIQLKKRLNLSLTKYQSIMIQINYMQIKKDSLMRMNNFQKE